MYNLKIQAHSGEQCSKIFLWFPCEYLCKCGVVFFGLGVVNRVSVLSSLSMANQKWFYSPTPEAYNFFIWVS